MRSLSASNKEASPATPNFRHRRWVARGIYIGVTALILASLATFLSQGYLSRLSYDLLLPLQKLVTGPKHNSKSSKVVVVAVDEETYSVKPFSSTPWVAWTKHIGQVIAAIDAAGPTVMGFDFIYPTTLDQKGLLRGYDKPLLKALYKSGRQNRMVMGSVKFGDNILEPYRMHRLALGGQKNIRLLNITVDRDDVIRSYPAGHPLQNGKLDPSFANELVKRAGGKASATDFLINFNTGSPAIPTYSFVDLWRCASKLNTEFFQKNFAGKIVLFGSAVDIEDRKVPANRFALDRSVVEQSKAAAPRCTGKRVKIREMARSTVPGVFIHAAAINTLMRYGVIQPLNAALVFAVGFLAVTFLVLLFFRLSPFPGAIATVFAIAIAALAATGLLAANFLTPIIPLSLAILAAFPATYGYRFIAEDKEKRIIKNAFQHYLAPELIEELSENPEALKLGGVSKTLSIYFSDIAGFTTISEGMADEPERLVELMNQYLTRCTEIIESHGGYVDKYIGDAVMAIWGAPMDCPDGARRSVESALDIRWELTVFSADVVQGQFGLSPIGTRMGINTGIAVVGNMGSEKRFNYTVTGDTVNLAARLEGANKSYGTDFMIGETTLRAMRNDFKLAGIEPDDDDYIVTRRLDRLVVKGKTLPVKVYDVLGKRGDISDDGMEMIRQFHHGLALYYKRRFAEAKTVFENLAPESAAVVYVERCDYLIATPPENNWDGSFTMTTK